MHLSSDLWRFFTISPCGSSSSGRTATTCSPGGWPACRTPVRDIFLGLYDGIDQANFPLVQGSAKRLWPGCVIAAGKLSQEW